MTDENLAKSPGYQLAKALEALRILDEQWKEMSIEHKKDREVLIQEITRLKMDILTGQKQLPLEPVDAEIDEHLARETGEIHVMPGALRISEVLDSNPSDEMTV